DRPHRFSSPMLAAADLPPAPLPGAPPPVRHELANRARDPHRANPIRVVSAPPIREASASAADQVSTAPAAQQPARAALPAPHRLPSDALVAALRTPTDLRALVGRRDKRDPITAALAWSRELGVAVEARTGEDVIAWATQRNVLAAPTEPAAPGDLLVFDHANSDAEADLVAIVIARDPRGVTELIYVGGGVIRRGFVDPARRRMRRDAEDRIVNTFIRHGKRWPAKGSHYLASELLAHVVHTR
ncbi:MAG: hypothetical protein H0T42_13640, partial [Deltaproteobacteria bacterium]|nr:hypothetical protein [Deltaproteobacteria bacterium]